MRCTKESLQTGIIAIAEAPIKLPFTQQTHVSATATATATATAAVVPRLDRGTYRFHSLLNSQDLACDKTRTLR